MGFGMSKKDYISDNLVDIRVRFKQNYAAVAAARNAEESAAAPTQTAAAPIAAASPAPAAVPEIAAADGDPAGRARRELAIRLARDLAATAAELEKIEIRRTELRRWHEELKALESELPRAASAGAVETLRYRAVQAAGRGGVFMGSESAPGGAGSGEARSRWLDALPFVFGMVLAAALVALTLVFIFL